MRTLQRCLKIPSLVRFLQVCMALMLTALFNLAHAVDDPNQISFTLEGCNRDHGGSLVSVDPPLCSENGYTTGNMGKSWAELDLVPHRVTVRNGNGEQTYRFIISGDYTNNAGGFVGWDFITEPILDVANSDAGCQAPVAVGALTITPSGAGVGGADQTIYRTLDIQQDPDETCVYIYAQRLAVGASLFSGSSLQSNLWN